MKIKHTLGALSLAAVVTLAGCSGGGDSQDPAAQPDGQPAASDGGGQQPGGEMPEADLSDVPEVVAEVNGDEISKEEFRSEEHTSELQSRGHLVCRPLLEK